jgi:uncharacterized protein
VKINQELRTRIENGRLDQKAQLTGNRSFRDMVQKQEGKLQFTELERMMQDIHSQGDRLARSRTFQDLAKYKNLVKRFVKEAVDSGMNLKQSHSWNAQGQGRSLTVVEKIDEKLVELTEEVIKKENQSIGLLGKIGEIKGLLVNLYM